MSRTGFHGDLEARIPPGGREPIKPWQEKGNTQKSCWSAAPHDLSFAAIRRTPPPGLSYAYDFNFVPTAGFMARRFGLRGLLRMGWMMVRGRWGDDYTHRAPEQGTAAGKPASRSQVPEQR